MGNVKYFFKSLYSNQTVLNERKKPWYLAFIMLFLALALIWIPPFYHFMNTKGSAPISGNYGIDLALTRLVRDKNVEQTTEGNTEVDYDYGFSSSVIDENHKFVATEKFKELATFTETKRSGIEIFQESQGYVDGVLKPVSIKTLSVFYFDGDPLAQDSRKPYQDMFANIFKDKDGKDLENKFSFMIVSHTSIQIALYPLNADSKANAARSFTGYFKGLENTEAITMDELIFGKDTPEADKTEALATKNWKKLLDLSYTPIAAREFYTYLGVNLGGTLLIGFIAGLIIFVATRGKTNTYKTELTYWQATKMGITISFTPALLGFIAGFLFGNQWGIVVVLAGTMLRCMFTINKTRKHDGDKDKPLYQART